MTQQRRPAVNRTAPAGEGRAHASAANRQRHQTRIVAGPLLLDLRWVDLGTETGALFRCISTARAGDRIDIHVRRGQWPPYDLGAVDMRHIAEIRILTEDSATRQLWHDALAAALTRGENAQ